MTSAGEVGEQGIREQSNNKVIKPIERTGSS